MCMFVYVHIYIYIYIYYIGMFIHATQNLEKAPGQSLTIQYRGPPYEEAVIASCQRITMKMSMNIKAKRWDMPACAQT